MKRLMIMVAIVAVVAAACASDDSAQPTDTLPMNDDSSGTETEPIPTEPDEGIGDGAGPLLVVSDGLVAEVESAVRDLSKRLGDDALIQIVVAYEVTWSDGSKGCPEPGTSYTQALVDGYRIELESDGTSFQYHGAAGDLPFLCENDVSADGDEDGGGFVVPTTTP